MRYLVIALAMLFGSPAPATAQLSINFGFPGVSIGINLPVYPELVRVPNYPVYYAPGLRSNYFFFDGMYWVYQDDNWYVSTWYNGPWRPVKPEFVPLFVLRIPVRYYRDPPRYFRGWRPDDPPRWGEHWGNDWERGHSGWDRWNRRAAPAPAPLPVYQQRYSGDRYPHAEQQPAIQSQNYRYRPNDPVVREHFRQQAVPAAPAPREQPSLPQPAPQERHPRQPDLPPPGPAPRAHEDVPRAVPPPPAPPQPHSPVMQAPRKPPPQNAAEHEPQAAPPRAGQKNAAPQEPGRGRGPAQDKEKDREKDDERGQAPQRSRP